MCWAWDVGETAGRNEFLYQDFLHSPFWHIGIYRPIFWKYNSKCVGRGTSKNPLFLCRWHANPLDQGLAIRRLDSQKEGHKTQLCSSLEFIGVHYNLDRVQTTAILPMTLHTLLMHKKSNGGKQLVTQFLRQNCGVMIRNHGRWHRWCANRWEISVARWDDAGMMHWRLE